MKIFKFILLSILISSPVYCFDFFEDVKPQFRGVELAYGPYDIFTAPIFTVKDWLFLPIKPVYFRYNPFNNEFSIGSIVEYFPVTQFQPGLFFISDELLNPFIFLGYKVLINYPGLSFPAGAGIQIPVFRNFYIGFKVYYELTVLPLFIGRLGWDFSFEFKIKKF